MRKSERIRVLELEVLRQQYELEYLKITLQAMMESKGLNIPEMDAGKWYNRKPKE
jgi:hypothetical protein